MAIRACCIKGVANADPRPRVKPAPSAPRASGLALALLFALGCAASREQAGLHAAARAASASPSAPSAAISPPAASAGVAAPAPAGSGPAASDGATLPAPPSPDQHNLFGLVRSAGDLAGEEGGRVASPDGGRVAFVRSGSEKGKASLWVASKDGSQTRMLVDAASARVENPHDGAPLAETSGLFGLSFSADGKTLYFQADGWATSLALYSVEIDSGAVRYVHDANGYVVIRACKDKKHVGRLIILEHRYFDPIPTSAVDWYFLIDDRAGRHGIVGPDPENVDRFLARRCGVGAAPPDPPRSEVPPRLRSPRLDCGGQLVAHHPLSFLDGTTLDLFFATDKETLKTDKDALPWVLDLEAAKGLLDSECPTRAK
jgi:hypothetical protein